MKIKEEIKKTGTFWIPSFPEPVSGVLSISNERGIELEVAQSLVNDPASIVHPFRNLDSFFQVIGHIQEYGFLILDGCYISNSGLNFNLSQIQTSQTIRATRVFTGFPHIQHLQNGIPSFNTFKFSIEGIDEWLWIHCIDENYNHEEYTLTISCNPPESILLNLTDGMRLEITVEMENDTLKRPWGRGVTQKAYFKLVSEEPQELDEFFSVAQKIVHLLCFTINDPVQVDSLSVTSNAICKDHGEGTTPYPAPITIYVPSIYHSKDEPKIDWTRMLFRFSDIQDNAEGMINKWLESYEDYKNAFDLYFLAQLKPQLSLEVKFLTLAQDLEVYHRQMSSDDAPEMSEVKLKYKEFVQELVGQYPDEKDKKWLEGKLGHLNDVSLGQRIKGLINPFKELIGNSRERDKLAHKIAVTRNYLTHYNPCLESEAAKGEELHVLCLKMELLFELHFLKLTGFTPEKIESIASSCPKLTFKRSS